MKRSGKILLEGTIEEFKKHCKGADNREYLLINTKEIKKDGTYTIYQQDSTTERMTSISAKGKYSKSFIPYEEYLTLVATSAGTFLFTGLGANKILYSKDKGDTWSEPLQTVTINVQKGNSVLWKGEMTPYNSYSGSGIGTFSGTATFEAKGNVMSLLFCDNYIGKTSLENKNNAFAYLWRYSKIIKAHNLSLPAKILSPYCYNNMFSNCNMLTTTPKLPATTLANYCYLSMFYGCTSLSKAPELPATTLADYCYNLMFLNCQSLNYIKMLATDISANGCLNSWVGNVSKSGTLVKAASMTTLPSGSNGIPNGWAVEDATE